jgi:hypothetical protein
MYGWKAAGAAKRDRAPTVSLLDGVDHARHSFAAADLAGDAWACRLRDLGAAHNADCRTAAGHDNCPLGPDPPSATHVGSGPSSASQFIANDLATWPLELHWNWLKSVELGNWALRSRTARCNRLGTGAVAAAG